MDSLFMKQAIKAAQRGRYHTFTNPLVGAVLVKDGKVIGVGAHLAYGKAHAERNAIDHCQNAGELFNSTLYVTLEPCDHEGKQPPCTEAIIQKGIKKVVVAQLDPNPLVTGKGIKKLRLHGIQVVTGVEEQAARVLNQHYNFFYEQGRPFITLKQAVTLDGKVSISANDRTKLTGEKVWQQVHTERSAFQGIVAGSQTVLTDDPYLLSSIKSDYPPVRIILDRRGRLFSQPQLNIFQDSQSPVWLFTERKSHQMFPPHVTVFEMKHAAIQNVIAEVTKQGLQSLYVEGGPTVHDTFLASGLWDELITYITPKVIGGDSLASFSSKRQAAAVTQLTQVSTVQIGQDYRISGRRK